jgi:hypothetical protein
MPPYLDQRNGINPTNGFLGRIEPEVIFAGWVFPGRVMCETESPDQNLY